MDQARIQNNVALLMVEHVLCDNDTQELLARSDFAARSKAMRKVDELGSKFGIVVVSS